MIRALCLAAVLALSLADTSEPKIQPDAKAEEIAAEPSIPLIDLDPIRMPLPPYNDRVDGLSGGYGPNLEKQKRIVQEVYSPTYVEPTWILDYRFLRTGGRDYTRTSSGQVVILPRNVRSPTPNQFPNYDALLDYLEKVEMHRRDIRVERGGESWKYD